MDNQIHDKLKKYKRELMTIENPDADENMTIEQAILQLQDAITSQGEIHSQMMRRTNLMMQMGVLLIILLTIGVAYLTLSLKSDMNKMNGYMQSMTSDVSSMSQSMNRMKSSMGGMKQGIDEVVGYTHDISRAIVQSDNSVAVMTHIANSVTNVQNDFQSLNQNVSSINYNLSTINKQLRNLNKKLGVMGQDVNRMSSPVKMFPF